MAATSQCADENDFHALPGSLFSRLRLRGYLYFSQADEDTAFDAVMAHYRVPPTEVQSAVVPTMGCFFNCTYCFEPAAVRHRSPVMRHEQLEAAMASIRERVKTGGNRLVRVFGGEPLQPRTKAIIEEPLGFAGSEGLTLQITTNGYYASEYAELFRRYPSVPLYIQITLDGVASTHDAHRPLGRTWPTFGPVARGIDACADLPNVTVTVRQNFHPEMYDDYAASTAAIKQREWNLRDNVQFQLASLFPSYDKDGMQIPERDALDLVDVFVRDVLGDAQLSPGHFTTTVFSSEASYLATVFGFQVPGIHTRTDCFTPRVVYCHAAVDSAKHVYAPDGYVYNCLNMVGNSAAVIGEYGESGTVEYKEEIENWSR